MKRALVAVAVAGVLVAGASPAPAATKLERQVAALQRQVTSLRKQVTTLRRQVTTTSTCPSTATTLPPVCELALEAAVVAYCDAAITADAFQNTWAVINQIAPSPIFAAPVTLSDGNLCQALGVLRQPTLVPPTVSPFQQMLGRLSSRPVSPLFIRPFWLWSA